MFSCISWRIGRGFKLKKWFWIIAIPKFDVPMYIKMESTSPNEFRGDLPRGVGPSNIYDPLYNSKKKFVPFIGFMVLKTTGLSSRFQWKNRFWKICTECWEIGQNVRKYGGLVWRPEFWHNFANISGPAANFSKPIFALKPWTQAGHFEYHELYKRNKNFFEL